MKDKKVPISARGSLGAVREFAEGWIPETVVSTWRHKDAVADGMPPLEKWPPPEHDGARGKQKATAEPPSADQPGAKHQRHGCASTSSPMEVDPSPTDTADSSEQDCDFEEVEVEQVEVRRSGRVSVPADHFNQSQHAAWTDSDLNKPHARVRVLGESYDERGEARDTACAEVEHLRKQYDDLKLEYDGLRVSVLGLCQQAPPSYPRPPPYGRSLLCKSIAFAELIEGIWPARWVTTR